MLLTCKKCGLEINPVGQVDFDNIVGPDVIVLYKCPNCFVSFRNDKCKELSSCLMEPDEEAKHYLVETRNAQRQILDRPPRRVRSHTLYWDYARNVPSYVNPISGLQGALGHSNSPYYTWRSASYGAFPSSQVIRPENYSQIQQWYTQYMDAAVVASVQPQAVQTGVAGNTTPNGDMGNVTPEGSGEDPTR